MKQLTLVLLFFSFASACHSQKMEEAKSRSSHPSYDVPSTQKHLPPDYLAKSKNQKTGAWLLVSGGIGVLVITGILAASNLDFSGTRDRSSAFGIGLSAAMASSSIPFFIASSRNKRKAMSASASLKMENAPLIHRSGTSRIYYPTASIKISFK